ncbi:hypothetical protein TRIATDRAFT_301051 [Trichoderma atroviride IMI 206040]|uniref:Uncharacterized protein n=1 Tax=Hypocrea atroviridis (strain ATCC 20476 / IMI 206040) TaxID=452589 RepID=G9P0D6_HYPAI|nr:uncharacterized protein TRIATDRAFT_301051 [Trichoderma atroviride IMI 206040]EHK43127.1 hypothetical protein TRIATDRAFT_301051 [Trichoderma atroviride IMI 206040]
MGKLLASCVEKLCKAAGKRGAYKGPRTRADGMLARPCRLVVCRVTRPGLLSASATLPSELSLYTRSTQRGSWTRPLPADGHHCRYHTRPVAGRGCRLSMYTGGSLSCPVLESALITRFSSGTNTRARPAFQPPPAPHIRSSTDLALAGRVLLHRDCVAVQSNL